MPHTPALARGLLALTALAATSLAQTFTSCNPLEKTCPSDPALGTQFNQTFGPDSSLSKSSWNITGAPAPTFGSDGSSYTISKQGEAPTVATPYYIFWGTVSVIMKASPGQGIVSSIVLLSDDLDEIDWEIMGGNTTTVETNYYGKGNSTQMNAIYYPCSNPSPQDGMHNYTIVWNADATEWLLDGVVVRTLKPADALDADGNSMYPQTPMQLKIGNWAGGDPGNGKGTIEWAGGLTDFSQAPFTMEVQSVWVTDGTSNAKSYSYGDNTGSWQSIKVEQGQSEADAAIHAPPALSISERWAALSPTAQIAIVASAGAVGLALTILFLICCIRQRRRGRREREGQDAAWEKDQIEMLEYKRMMQGPPSGSFASHAAMQQQQDYTGGSYGNVRGGPTGAGAFYGAPAGYGKPQGYVHVQGY